MRKFLALSLADKIFFILTLLMCVGMLIYSTQNGVDFHVFYLAGQRVLADHPIYQAQDSWMVFKYHPIWAVFFLFWALVPEKISVVLFGLLSLYIWWFLVQAWAQRLNWSMTVRNWFLLVLFSLSAFSTEIGFGQMNGLIFLGLMQVFYHLENEQPSPLRAGLWLAMVISIKINFGLMVFYVLFRNGRAMFGVALGFILFHICMVFYTKHILDYKIYQQWISILVSQSSAQVNTYEVQGLMRFFIATLGNFGKAAWAACIFIFVAGAWTLEKIEARDSNVKLLFWITGLYLLSPLSWWYQIIYAFPLIFFLLNKNLRVWEKWTVRICLFLIAFVNYNTIGKEGIIFFKDIMGYFILSMIVVFIFLKEFFPRFWQVPSRPSLLK